MDFDQYHGFHPIWRHELAFRIRWFKLYIFAIAVFRKQTKVVQTLFCEFVMDVCSLRNGECRRCRKFRDERVQCSFESDGGACFNRRLSWILEGNSIVARFERRRVWIHKYLGERRLRIFWKLCMVFLLQKGLQSGNGGFCLVICILRDDDSEFGLGVKNDGNHVFLQCKAELESRHDGESCQCDFSCHLVFL